jgi:cytochrome b561
MRARTFKLIYLTAIAVPMIGWLWLLVEGFAWAIT